MLMPPSMHQLKLFVLAVMFSVCVEILDALNYMDALVRRCAIRTFRHVVFEVCKLRRGIVKVTGGGITARRLCRRPCNLRLRGIKLVVLKSKFGLNLVHRRIWSRQLFSQEDSMLAASVSTLICGQAAAGVLLVEKLLRALKCDRLFAIDRSVRHVDLRSRSAGALPEFLIFRNAVAVDEVHQHHEALRILHVVRVRPSQSIRGSTIFCSTGPSEDRDVATLGLRQRCCQQSFEGLALHRASMMLVLGRLIRGRVWVKRILVLRFVVQLHHGISSSQQQGMMVIICHVERRWHFLAGLVVDQHNVEVNALQMHGLASKFLHNLVRQPLWKNVSVVDFAPAKEDWIREHGEALQTALCGPYNPQGQHQQSQLHHRTSRHVQNGRQVEVPASSFNGFKT
mmetsp:Transcript_63390/g.131203  ORF Transcript_63390/g.131203 Transcript_63390/m.131203 type:complete len:397 (+) Transcript_63390:423-1613(+)